MGGSAIFKVSEESKSSKTLQNSMQNKNPKMTGKNKQREKKERENKEKRPRKCHHGHVQMIQRGPKMRWRRPQTWSELAPGLPKTSQDFPRLPQDFPRLPNFEFNLWKLAQGGTPNSRKIHVKSDASLDAVFASIFIYLLSILDSESRRVMHEFWTLKRNRRFCKKLRFVWARARFVRVRRNTNRTKTYKDSIQN